MRLSRSGLVAAYLVAAVAVVFTQSPPTPSHDLKFDVVSVKPCDPNVPPPAASRSSGASPGRLRLDCRRLIALIQTAYVVYANGDSNVPALRPDLDQRLGLPNAPDWVGKDLFTIEGRTDAVPAPTPAILLGPMLRAVLEDRFKLKMQHEQRAAPVFELIVAKGGSKLTPFKPGTCVPYDMNVSAAAASARSASVREQRWRTRRQQHGMGPNHGSADRRPTGVGFRRRTRSDSDYQQDGHHWPRLVSSGPP